MLKLSSIFPGRWGTRGRNRDRASNLSLDWVTCIKLILLRKIIVLNQLFESNQGRQDLRGYMKERRRCGVSFSFSLAVSMFFFHSNKHSVPWVTDAQRYFVSSLHEKIKSHYKHLFHVIVDNQRSYLPAWEEKSETFIFPRNKWVYSFNGLPELFATYSDAWQMNFKSNIWYSTTVVYVLHEHIIVRESPSYSQCQSTFIAMLWDLRCSFTILNNFRGLSQLCICFFFDELLVTCMVCVLNPQILR